MTDAPVALTVTLAEAVALCNLLGSLPVNQGGGPLWQKLVAQVQPLLPTEPEA